ncbi:MAG: amidohydrolase family protein, partial [Gemmatimonadales bacterium]
MRNSMLLMAVALAAVLVGIQTTCRSAAPDATADVILAGGKFFTLEDERPLAEALAIRGNDILAVGSRGEVWRHRGAGTVVVDLNGAFVVPGFIDSHTHFDNAGQLLLGVNLLDVSDAEALAERVDRARARLPDGAWVVGGDWGAYEEWAM